MNKFKLNSITRDKIAKIKNKPFVTVNLGRYDSNLDLVDVMSLKLEIVGHKVFDIKKVMCEMFVHSFRRTASKIARQILNKDIKKRIDDEL